ncbi:MAG: biotin/lipoyl-binding protein [Bacteroidetes bacterium]|nr:MAG: biotin/lipoyl-binding protein [Bacteroidota bacterium]
MTKKKKNNNKLLIALVGIIALLIVGAIYKSKQRPKGLKVQAEKAELRTITETVAASGKVFPVTEVKISSDVSGEIVELLVEEGDSVVRGQILARVDPDAYQSQVERGQAGVNSAKADLANAKAQVAQFVAQKEQIEAQLSNARDIHKRNEKLYKDGVISDADFDSSLANVKALEANLRAAEANIQSAKERARAAEFTIKSAEATLKELKTSLRRTTILAPMSGIVSLLNVEEGERVVGNQMMSGTEIMRIANLNEMEVQVEVSENDVPHVALHDDVEIEIDAYIDRKFKGKVTQIAHSANNISASGAVSLTTDQVTNFVVKIDILPESYADLVAAGKKYPFRPGMSASVEIFTNTVEDALSIPIQAVSAREKSEIEKQLHKGNAQKVNQKSAKEEDDLVEIVFVIESDTVRIAEVKTGIQDDEYIQVLSGLNAGEMVVTGPYSAVSRKLKQGDTVEIDNDAKEEKSDDEE